MIDAATGSARKKTAIAAFNAVELTIRRLRLLASAVLVGVAVTGRAGITGTLTTQQIVALTAFPIVLLMANAVSKATGSGTVATRAMIIGQLAADTIVTVGALWVLNPERGSYAFVVVGLPVLHGALRYRLTGAFAVWLAVAIGLATRVIVDWQPGTGLQPLFDVVIPLAIALAAAIPAGHLADQLTEEIGFLRSERHLSERHSRLLAVLTIAGQDFSNQNREILEQTSVEAAAELGFLGAELLDTSNKSAHNVVSSAGLRRPEIGDANEAPDERGQLVQALDGVWLATVQEAPNKRVLRVWNDEDSDEWRPRTEALELLSRNVASALTAAQGYEDLEVAVQRHRHAATHDPLTGILNRGGLLEAYSTRQASIKLGNGTSKFGVFVLDLDGFKAVNDTHGHDAGDAVLVATASRLPSAVDGLIALARAGGDEFVILADVNSGDDVQSMIDSIEESLNQPFRIDGHTVDVGVSVGCYVVDSAATTAEDAMRSADVQMYMAKRRSSGETAKPAS
jgi:diguanylate cyclase (GGDEF)-like protein